MNDSQTQFHQRLRRLDTKHEALTRGYETVMRPNGLVMALPSSAQAPSRIPIRPGVFLIAALFLLKAILIVSVGEATYDARVEQLRQGTLIEHAGAVAMQADPVSQFLALKLRPYLR